MPALQIHQEMLSPQTAAALIQLCPFGALSMENGRLEINAACKMCRLCVKRGPAGVMEIVEDEVAQQPADLSDWNGIAVYAQQVRGEIAPVVPELLGKARQLAGVVRAPVYALLIGHGMGEQARRLLHFGADTVYVYDDPLLSDFRVLPYAAVFEDMIRRVKPSAVLVGATNLGRSLAPRVAARFATGLTADCTRLEMKPNGDLVQIRPAFGGNIMAQIITPKHRPQFCTVRYKVFPTPCPEAPHGRIQPMAIEPERLRCGTTVLEHRPKDVEADITDADAVVVVGRGIKSQRDLALAQKLADALGAQLACTRPLVENGWFNPKRQVGLSGRTIAPRLLVTLGVSGAVQFTAAIRGAETVLAINNDPDAPIFEAAQVGMVGDLYAVVPMLLEKIRLHAEEACQIG
ncbi:MAG: electron transfer flavoprotein subunit alpha [Clostridiales bacterium]|nr:electron transfer flavoprotein subunit alpha [Clostridiales bacterium]